MPTSTPPSPISAAAAPISASERRSMPLQAHSTPGTFDRRGLLRSGLNLAAQSAIGACGCRLAAAADNQGGAAGILPRAGEGYSAQGIRGRLFWVSDVAH